jgi:hypothetical protein
MDAIVCCLCHRGDERVTSLLKLMNLEHVNNLGLIKHISQSVIEKNCISKQIDKT